LKQQRSLCHNFLSREKTIALLSEGTSPLLFGFVNVLNPLAMAPRSDGGRLLCRFLVRSLLYWWSPNRGVGFLLTYLWRSFFKPFGFANEQRAAFMKICGQYRVDLLIKPPLVLLLALALLVATRKILFWCPLGFIGTDNCLAALCSTSLKIFAFL